MLAIEIIQMKMHVHVRDSCVIELIIDYCRPSPILMQDGDEASPVLTSCDIVKVPDPQMCMVRTHARTHAQCDII